MSVLVVAVPAMSGTPLRPRTSPGSWVAIADYPPSALRYGIEGVVGFRLTINREGNVDRCEVTQSSASEILDSHTCRLLEKRASFYPARDAKGKAIQALFSARFRWQIQRPVAAEAAPVI
jgi:periplasmic protein TonB